MEISQPNAEPHQEHPQQNQVAAPFKCKYCGADSWIDPSDQTPPFDYCHEIDHGTEEDRAAYAE